MNAQTLILCGLAGATLGLLFFAALRATVDRLPGTSHPGALLLASLLARIAVALAVFYAVARLGNWPGLVASLVGFVAVRTVFLRRLRSTLPTPRGDGKGGPQ